MPARARMRFEAEELMREGEKLVTAPTSLLARFLWQQEPALAAPKFAAAANKFAYCEAVDLARYCFEKAATYFEASEQYHSAGQNLEKSFGLCEEPDVLQRAGEAYVASGQPLTAAESLLRGGKKVDDEGLVSRALDYADAGGGPRGIETSRACFLWLVSKRKLDKAIAAAETVEVMMGNNGVEVSEPTRARLVAAVVVLRLFASLEAATSSFLAALPTFVHTNEARFVDDLLAACQARDQKALKEATAPSKLHVLDFDVAALARDLSNDLPRRAWWNEAPPKVSLQENEEAPTPPLPQQGGEEGAENDELPDIS